MEIANLLKEFDFGKVQKSGIMSVIPLIGKDATESIATFKDISFIGTTNYGSMSFSNNSKNPFIVPSGYSVITKQHAQDHGLPTSVIIDANCSRQEVDNACCIEQTQPGFIHGPLSGDVFNILPYSIRKKYYNSLLEIGSSLEKRMPLDLKDFTRLWEIIREFQNKLVKENEAHLVYFFNKYIEELSKFNALFEPVEGQRGAIILINGEIIGIEIVPTADYWNVIWNPLIRDCYGSEVIRTLKGNIVKDFNEYKENELILDECKSIDEIRQKLENYNLSILKTVESKLDKVFLNKEIKEHSTSFSYSSTIKYKCFKSIDENFYGEIYLEDETFLYASILTKIRAFD